MDRLDAFARSAAFLRLDEGGFFGAAGLRMSTTWTPLYLHIAPPQAARYAYPLKTPTSAILSATTFFSSSCETSCTFAEVGGR